MSVCMNSSASTAMTMLATSVTTVLYVTVYIRNGIFIGKNMILVDQHPLHYLYFHAAD